MISTHLCIYCFVYVQSASAVTGNDEELPVTLISPVHGDGDCQPVTIDLSSGKVRTPHADISAQP